MTATIGDIAVRHAADDALAVRMAQFYIDLDAAITQRSPVCTNRGLCCNFQTYGHDLFVTSVELSYFLRGHRQSWHAPATERKCAWQIDARCTAREHRPMGCRVFFCDETSHDWQTAEYETRLAELKEIHTAFGVEYRYHEWLSALKTVSPVAADENSESPPTIEAAQFIDPRRLPVIESK